MEKPKLKLSEAILIGSKLRPQAFYNFFDDGIYDYMGIKQGTGELCSCVLGAVVEATFGRTEHKQIICDPSGNETLTPDADELFTAYPQLLKHADNFIGCCNHSDDSFYFEHLINLLVHLNTYHKWPREKIADMLERKGL